MFGGHVHVCSQLIMRVEAIRVIKVEGIRVIKVEGIRVRTKKIYVLRGLKATQRLKLGGE